MITPMCVIQIKNSSRYGTNSWIDFVRRSMISDYYNEFRNLPHYMIVDACMYFSRYCAKEMGDLRMNFLTHCINYYDYQVLSPKQLYDIMMVCINYIYIYI